MNRFKELRKSANLTQQAVADMLSVRQNTYSNWERGVINPSVDIVETLSSFYGVSTDYLLGLSEQQKSSVPQMDTEREKKRIAFIAAYDAMPPEEQDLFYEWLQLRGKL